MINYFTFKHLRKILKNDPQYLMIIGQRSNGKSYAVKEHVLRRYVDKGKRFVYMRRYDTDIKDYEVISYFDDMREKVKELTHDNYDHITIFRKGIYLAFYDDEMKERRGDRIGYVVALNNDEHLKSQTFPDTETVIYEEFVTANLYLPNEPTRLFNVISTIARNGKVNVIMIGNTVSRINPYFTEWELNGAIRQKQDTLELYEFREENEVVRVGVYLCNSISHNSGMFFGTSARMINKGLYHSDPQPSLEDGVEMYEVKYSVVFEYNEHKFLMQFLRHKMTGTYTWYIQPKNTPIQKGTRVVSNIYTSDPLTTLSFNTFLSDGERKIFETFRAGKIAYSDDLTGTEFKQCYRQFMATKII